MTDIALCGEHSRRQACRLIEAGRVSLNGKSASHTDVVEYCHGDDVFLQVEIDGSPIYPVANYSYWIYHKPVGIDCRLLPHDPSSIIHQLDLPTRVYPAGRLYKDSRGLLLLTNDGHLTQHLLHPDFGHYK
ncbi:MAG: pseudouridine synthase [Shewanella sp.]